MRFLAVFALFAFHAAHGSESSQSSAQEKWVEEVLGDHYLKSTHGTFLRAWQGDNFESYSAHLPYFVDMAPHNKECERWIIEKSLRNAAEVTVKVFRTYNYLRAESDDSVRLGDSRWRYDKWIPSKNDDGSWSLQSHYGGWLTADKNGSVYTVTEEKGPWQSFRLLPWKWTDDEDAESTTTSATPSAASISVTVPEGTTPASETHVPNTEEAAINVTPSSASAEKAALTNSTDDPLRLFKIVVVLFCLLALCAALCSCIGHYRTNRKLEKYLIVEGES